MLLTEYPSSSASCVIQIAPYYIGFPDLYVEFWYGVVYLYLKVSNFGNWVLILFFEIF